MSAHITTFTWRAYSFRALLHYYHVHMMSVGDITSNNLISTSGKHSDITSLSSLLISPPRISSLIIFVDVQVAVLLLTKTNAAACLCSTIGRHSWSHVFAGRCVEGGSRYEDLTGNSGCIQRHLLPYLYFLRVSHCDAVWMSVPAKTP